MSTLVQRPFGTPSSSLQLLQRRSRTESARAPAAVRRSLADRVDAWLTTLPEPRGGHRLGSWLSR